MRLFTTFMAILTLVGCRSVQSKYSEGKLPSVIASDTLLQFAAKPRAGYKFDYLIYLPKGLKSDSTTYLMVETNNTGLNDTIAYHEKKARHAALRSGVGNYTAWKLQIPLLMPIFPRSQTDWTLYTHALDRDVLLSKGTDIERLDLQLLAMIDDARKQLAKHGYRLHDKFFIQGFSASGTFANRFTMLHPRRVKAMAAGGINAIPILPVLGVEGQTLNYPVGIADLPTIIGKPVDMEGFKAVPQLLYMGAQDDNDAVAFDDAYSKEDRELVFRLMGKQLVPQRWSFMESVYRAQGINAEFRTYPNIGHGTDRKINNDLVEYFRKHMN
jgi:pimeloyl-ACP methyl ester carboxylesterase